MTGLSVLGSASLNSSVVGTHGGALHRGEGAEPSTDLPVSRELGLVIAEAHVAWARRYQPWLLESWLDD